MHRILADLWQERGCRFSGTSVPLFPKISFWLAAPIQSLQMCSFLIDHDEDPLIRSY